MANTETDNAAVRLHRILSLIGAGPGSSEATADVLRERTGLAPARVCALLYGLLEEVRAGVRAAEPPEVGQAHLELIEPIEDWLSSLDLRQPWGNRAPLPDHAITALLTCSRALTETRPLRPLSDADVEALGKRVEELRAEVMAASNVETRLRIFLLRHLDEMRSALDAYAVAGSSALVDAVTYATGDFATSRPLPETEEEETLWRRFVNLCKDITAVAAAVAIGAGVFTAGLNYVADAFEVLRDSAAQVQPAGEQEQKALPSGEVRELAPAEPAEQAPPED